MEPHSTSTPVTVPIVLASGVALGRAVTAAEGFGILTCASIGPILSVLVAGLMNRPARRNTSAPLDEPLVTSSLGQDELGSMSVGGRINQRWQQLKV